MCHNNEPIATAIAWRWDKDPETGYVHMVGADPRYKGNGLGYQVSLATLHQMAAENRQSVILHTDDFRLPAIAIYLRLGFEPEITHESHEARWEDIYTRISENIC